MKKWLIGGIVVAVAAAGMAFLWPLSSVAQQARYRAPRTPDGKPDLNGVWQALNNAHWDIEDHVARQGPVFSLGAAFSVPEGYGVVEGDPQYTDIQRRLAALPVITVPSITMDGADDGVIAPTDGAASAPKFTARRAHRIIPRAGHNLPQEAPEAFAAAVMELLRD